MRDVAAQVWDGECLYCRRIVASRGVEHVYPEALGHHDMTLPRGAVCDRCNGKALRRLDDAVAAHPHIGVVLMLYDVAGKRGRVRARHGMLERRDKGLHLAPPRTWVEETRVDHERKRIFVRVAPPPEFRSDLFCRGLFKIALNLVAHADGVGAALRPEYDQVRRFVVAPVTKETLLPYVQRTPPMDERAVDAVRFARYREGAHDSVAMWLLGGEFFVDLRQPERVCDLVRGSAPADRSTFKFHDSRGEVTDWDGTALGPVDFAGAER